MRKRLISANPVFLQGITCLCLLFFAACDNQKTENLMESIAVEETAKESVQERLQAETAKESVQERLQAEAAEKMEIPVDYPFPSNMEGYTLALVPSVERPDEYEVKLCNESGMIVQQFPCGSVTESVQFRYALPSYGVYQSLVIFPSADPKAGQLGLLFAMDGETETFIEEPIEIPWYDEYDKIRGVFLTFQEDTEHQETWMFQVNTETGMVVDLRRWNLLKNTNELKIWDCMEDKILFEGVVERREDGSLEHAEYYDYLFLGNLHLTWGDERDSTIYTWVSDDIKNSTAEEDGLQGFEWAQNQVFGNQGYTAEYPDRQAFLSAFEFAGKEPFYQYHDPYENLQLELYLDQSTGTGGGLRYSWSFTNDLKKTVTITGFTFQTMQGEWKEADPFSMTAIDGSEPDESYDDFLTYTDTGKPDHYKCEGVIEWLDDTKGVSNILEINWIFRKDGSLFYRDYWHNSYIWGTTFLSLDSYYDEKERVIYEDGYITHGSYEFYYIYEDEDKKPEYCLQIDNNLNYSIPTMVRFK